MGACAPHIITRLVVWLVESPPLPPPKMKTAAIFFCGRLITAPLIFPLSFLTSLADWKWMTFFLVNIPREGEENRQLFTVLKKERKNWILRRAARECARDISPTEREEEEKPSEGSSSNPSSSRSAQTTVSLYSADDEPRVYSAFLFGNPWRGRNQCPIRLDTSPKLLY